MGYQGTGTQGNLLTANAAGVLPNFQAPAPLQSAFLANITTPITNATGDATIATVIYNQTDYDIHSDYNNATGVFTAPFTGFYLFTFAAAVGNLSSGHTLAVLDIVIPGASIETARVNAFATQGLSASDILTLNGSFITKLIATNTVFITVQVSNSTKTVTIEGAEAPTWAFSGAFLG